MLVARLGLWLLLDRVVLVATLGLWLLLDKEKSVQCQLPALSCGCGCCLTYRCPCMYTSCGPGPGGEAPRPRGCTMTGCPPYGAGGPPGVLLRWLYANCPLAASIWALCASRRSSSLRLSSSANGHDFKITFCVFKLSFTSASVMLFSGGAFCWCE